MKPVVPFYYHVVNNFDIYIKIQKQVPVTTTGLTLTTINNWFEITMERYIINSGKSLKWGEFTLGRVRVNYNSNIVIWDSLEAQTKYFRIESQMGLTGT